MNWTAVVGFISMGVSVVCAAVSLGIGAYYVRRAFRDQAETERNRRQA